VVRRFPATPVLTFPAQQLSLQLLADVFVPSFPIHSLTCRTAIKRALAPATFIQRLSSHAAHVSTGSALHE